MTIRVATWNCADGFAKKFHYLERINADIFCIQEVREKAFHQVEHLFAHSFYQSSNTARGLAIFFRNECGAKRLDLKFAKRDQCYLSLSFRSAEQWVDLLGVWVKPVEDYVRPSLRVFRRFLKHAPSTHRIMLGDFNQNKSLDKGRRLGLFLTTERLMQRNEMRSLYHENTGDAFGAETNPTHHLTFNPARPYHLDYIFASQGLHTKSYQLFNPDPWLTSRRSDHLPMQACLEFDDHI